MSEQELLKIQEAFSLFDRDGDGLVRTDQLGTMVRAVGRNPTEANIKELCQSIDPSQQGQINFEQFLQALQAIPVVNAQRLEKELMEAFRIFDKEGKGTIATAELRHIMTSMGERLNEQEADELMREADPEQKGIVDYGKFVKKMMSV